MANLSTTTSSPEVPGQALTDAGANEANDTNTSTDNTMAAAEAAATATAAATVTAAEEGEDPLAQGLQTLLNPSIRVTSQTLSSVFLAQQELSGEIQRLASLLQQFLDVADPPVLRNTVVRLADTRRRLADVNNALLVLQTRINRTYVQLNRQRIPGGA